MFNWAKPLASAIDRPTIGQQVQYKQASLTFVGPSIAVSVTPIRFYALNTADTSAAVFELES
jgi:hypothetical protein